MRIIYPSSNAFMAGVRFGKSNNSWPIIRCVFDGLNLRGKETLIKHLLLHQSKKENVKFARQIHVRHKCRKSDLIKKIIKRAMLIILHGKHKVNRKRV